MRNNSTGNQQIMSLLQSVLENNPMTGIFKSAYEILWSQNHIPQPHVKLRLAQTPGTDPCRYNLPTAQEVSVIMPGQGDDVDGNTYRDIILHLRDGPFRRINELNPLYLPLHYVLLFPRGELGWHTNIALANSRAHSHSHVVNNFEGEFQNEENLDIVTVNNHEKTITQQEWYAYQLHI